MLLKNKSEAKYTIVSAKSVKELISEVERAIHTGFEPQGGVFTFTQEGLLWFGQAIVKK